MLANLLLAIRLASVLSGECGPIRSGCTYLVAQTMQTRLSTGGYGDTLAEVATQYAGHAAPTPDSLAAAWQLVRGRIRPGPWRYIWSGDRTGELVLVLEPFELNFATSATGR